MTHMYDVSDWPIDIDMRSDKYDEHASDQVGDIASSDDHYIDISTSDTNHNIFLQSALDSVDVRAPIF